MGDYQGRTVELRNEEVRAVNGKAVVELEQKPSVTDSGLHVVRENHGKNFQPTEDYEIGTVLSIGGEGWEPVEVGDRVMVRAISGGAAGADIGASVGRERGEIIVVDREEMVCKIGE